MQLSITDEVYNMSNSIGNMSTGVTVEEQARRVADGARRKAAANERRAALVLKETRDLKGDVANFMAYYGSVSRQPQDFMAFVIELAGQSPSIPTIERVNRLLSRIDDENDDVR